MFVVVLSVGSRLYHTTHVYERRCCGMEEAAVAASGAVWRAWLVVPGKMVVGVCSLSRVDGQTHRSSVKHSSTVASDADGSPTSQKHSSSRSSRFNPLDAYRQAKHPVGDNQVGTSTPRPYHLSQLLRRLHCHCRLWVMVAWWQCCGCLREWHAACGSGCVGPNSGGALAGVCAWCHCRVAAGQGARSVFVPPQAQQSASVLHRYTAL